MDVVSIGPLPVASLLWQPRPGAWMLTFACKATYLVQPIECELAPEQEPLYEADRHWSDDPAWSLHAPRDIVPIRPRADVVVVGHAFAPDGVPVRSLIARLVVADVDKTIEVFCDRTVTPDGVLHEGQRFDKMPLIWERAACGPDASNPVGIQPRARDRFSDRALPNLQPPGTVVQGPDDVIPPVGLGPIAPAWPLRSQKLGRHAATWSSDDWSRRPLPQDIDASYFNAAPRDQQAHALRDDERIVLDNLHPEHAHLVTHLPGYHPSAFVERPGKSPSSVSMRPDLLWIDTDRSLCTLTWRGQIPLDHPAEAGAVRIALEAPGQVLTWEDIERLAAQGTSPFAGAQLFEVAPTIAPSPLAPPAPPADGDDPVLTGTVTGLLDLHIAAAALPFAGAPAAAPRPDHGAPRVAGTPFAPAVPPGRSPSSPDWPAVAPLLDAAAPPPVAPPPLVRAPVLPAAAPSQPDAPWSAAPAHAPARPATIGEAALQSPGASRPAEIPRTGGDAFAASNAAAAASAPLFIPRVQTAPGAASPPPIRSGAQPSADPREILHLVWYDPDSVRRIRRQPAWRKILDALDQKPVDRDLDDDPDLAKDPMDIEDRRDVFEVLARASATDADGVTDALSSAIRDDGKYVPPLRLVAGDLLFPFDELETLKVIVTVVTPLIGNDESLRAAVASAQDFLKLPDAAGVPAVAEGFTARIRDTYAIGKRTVPLPQLDTQTERALLEQRSYQRRKVLAGPHLRALLLSPSPGASPIPTYLPAALAEALPMYARFRARLIAEVHLQVDQSETQPAALRALALVRAVPAPPRR